MQGRQTSVNGMQLRSRLLASLFSLGASAIHFLVAPTHFEEWWGYGLFFVLLGGFQAVYVLGLMFPARVLFGIHWYLQIGIVGNLLAIAIYLTSRTAGVPLFGPEAGEVEAVGVLDPISKVFELGLIGVLAHALFVSLSRSGGIPSSIHDEGDTRRSA